MSRRQLTYVLGSFALALWGSLLSGWRLSADRLSAGNFSLPVMLEKSSTMASANARGRSALHALRADTELPAGLADALNSPDPRERIRALETWAQHPGDTLDPVTYALVDPDESVRARAQELLEAVLARR